MTRLAVRVQTCAICGWRDATGATDVDGRIVPSCSSCVAEVQVDDEPPFHLDDLAVMPRAVYLARSRPGLTAREISDALGLPNVDERRQGPRNSVCVALGRAVRAGVLRRAVVRDNDEVEDEGLGSPWRFYPAATVWSPPMGGRGRSARRWSSVLAEMGGDE